MALRAAHSSSFMEMQLSSLLELCTRYITTLTLPAYPLKAIGPVLLGRMAGFLKLSNHQAFSIQYFTLSF